MHCWHCGALMSALSYGKVSFRATCDKCGSALHCCQNCKYYKIGQPNDCAIPGTDYIFDRTATNFCEEFSHLSSPQPPPFHDNKKGFEDLFK